MSLAAGLVLAGPQPDGGLDADTEARARAALEACAEGEVSAEVHEELVALGSAVLLQVAGGSGVEESTLRRALAGFSDEDVLVGVRTSVSDDSPLELRALALSLVGERGGAGEVGLLLDLAQGGQPGAPEVLRALREALDDLLDEPNAMATLAGRVRRVSTAIYVPVAEAAASAGGRDALRVLAQLLGTEPGTDLVVLEGIAEVAQDLRPPFAERLVEDVRVFLAVDEERMLAAACRAAGALQDHDGIERMIAVLHGHGMDVRSAAHGALKHLSGLGFRPDPKRWATWHATELEWWRSDAPEVLEVLRSGGSREVATAMGAVVTRRLYRDELAAEVLPLLTSYDEQLRLLSCIGLGQLGSPVGLPELGECLDDVSDSVREAAHRSLRSITGWDLPADPDAWREALEAADATNR